MSDFWQGWLCGMAGAVIGRLLFNWAWEEFSR